MFNLIDISNWKRKEYFEHYFNIIPYWIPLSIQVHHAVCDGFHVCRFINELQELLKD